MLRKLLTCLAIISCFFISVAFNACSKLTSNAENQNSAIRQPNSFETPPAIESDSAKGAKLYSQYCMKCHEEINQSSKKNKSSAQIIDAINSIPLMKSLNILSREQIRLIGLSLSSSTDSELLSHLNYRCEADQLNQRGLGKDMMNRLSKIEIVNTLESLIGTDTLNDSIIAQEIAKIPDDVVVNSPSDFAYSHSPYLVEVLFKVAQRTFEKALSDVNLKNKIFGSCFNPNAIASIDCVNQFIVKFGYLSYRRSLSSAEVQDHIDLYNQILVGKSNSQEAFRGIMTRFLLNPKIAFHLEIGLEQTSNQRRRITDFEVASRLAFGLASSPPDLIMLEKAKSGQLKKFEQIRAEAVRFISLNPSKVRNKSERFISFYAGLEKTETPYAYAAQALQISPMQIAKEFKDESLTFSSHVIWNKNGRFEELMTSRESFPTTDRLAKIFNSSKTTLNGQPVLLSEKYSGLLLRPAFLSSSHERTPVIKRGVNMVRLLTCQTVAGKPATPEEIANAQANLNIDLNSISNREVMAKSTSSAACIGCHSAFNPPGFVLESYDQVGQFRTTETTYTSQGQVNKKFAIDSKVEDLKFDPQKSTPVIDALEMMTLLSKSKNAKACFSKRLLEFYQLRSFENTTDSCLASDVYRSLISGNIQDALLSSVINEDLFWKKAYGN